VGAKKKWKERTIEKKVHEDMEKGARTRVRQRVGVKVWKRKQGRKKICDKKRKD
jgi:hypothetical protein